MEIESRITKSHVGTANFLGLTTILMSQKPNPADDPPLMKDDQTLLAQGLLTYKPLPGVLIKDKITPDDILQGRIGDCYFMASLSAVAESNPSFLRESIRLNRDGTFTVRFFNKGKPVYVKVDSDIPQDQSGRPIYGASADKGELWVSIMEKGYAKLNNGYNKIGNGGQMEPALETITGVKSKTDTLSKPAALYAQLSQALAVGCAVTAGTRNGEPSKGIVPTHAYTVLRVFEKDGQKQVTLRNPWGFYEWSGKGADSLNNGTFSMPLEDFQKSFECISMTNSRPKSANHLITMRMLAI